MYTLGHMLLEKIQFHCEIMYLIYNQLYIIYSNQNQSKLKWKKTNSYSKISSKEVVLSFSPLISALKNNSPSIHPGLGSWPVVSWSRLKPGRKVLVFTVAVQWLEAFCLCHNGPLADNDYFLLSQYIVILSFLPVPHIPYEASLKLSVKSFFSIPLLQQKDQPLPQHNY